ncbi:hypothetical protein ACFFNY_23545 [Paenibacillus hodogayensis]|uniref:Uncharacterized protein n=1 Tax=Paenibacillus hodogayensis TaxID=279208 RepID=A0ABV5W1X2_9BACL
MDKTLKYILEAEFAELDDDFTWLNEEKRKIARNRVIEMTGGLFRPNEDPIWSFQEVLD